MVELHDVSHPRFNLRDGRQKITKRITIVDDDTPKIAIVADSGSFNTAEDVGIFRAKLKLSEAVTNEFRFDVAVLDGTAISGTDYENFFISSQYLVPSLHITRVRFRSGITEVPLVLQLRMMLLLLQVI